MIQRADVLVFLLVFGTLLVSCLPAEDHPTALSDVKCRNARPGEKLKKLSDSGGLRLWIQPAGAQLWRESFRSVAEEYVEKLKKEGHADATITKIKWLLDFAYPTIGDQPVRQIDAPAEGANGRSPHRPRPPLISDETYRQ